MFTAHDAGHAGITHHFKTDTLIALFVADFCCGLSMGWWKSSHNVHHLITNDPVRSLLSSKLIFVANIPSLLGTRPGHPECAPLRNVTLFLQIDPLDLLRLYLCLGCRRLLRRSLPEIHLLPDNGHRSLQPLPTFLAPSALTPFDKPRRSVVDPSHRNRIHVLLLVSFRILPHLAIHPHVDPANPLCARISHRHHAAARPDHPLTLGHANGRPRPERVVPAAAVANNHGRGLPGMARLYPRRSTIPGNSPPFPSSPQAQLAAIASLGSGVLRRDGDRVQVLGFRRRQQGGVGTPGRDREASRNPGPMPEVHGRDG